MSDYGLRYFASRLTLITVHLLQKPSGTKPKGNKAGECDSGNDVSIMMSFVP